MSKRHRRFATHTDTEKRKRKKKCILSKELLLSTDIFSVEPSVYTDNLRSCQNSKRMPTVAGGNGSNSYLKKKQDWIMSGKYCECIKRTRCKSIKSERPHTSIISSQQLRRHMTLTMLLYVHRSEVAYQGRGGGGGEGGWESEGSTADTARKRPERPWTAARTMEVLRRCPLAIAQRLVHRATAFSTAVLGRVTRTMSVGLLLRNNPKRKKSNFRSPAPPPCSQSLLG